MRTLCFVFAMWAVPVLAQAELPDAGLPDASVGEGGAERGSEESDPNGMVCLSTSDCERGFACVRDRCVPGKIKNVGCSAAGDASGWLPLGLLALAWRRRRS